MIFDNFWELLVYPALFITFLGVNEGDMAWLVDEIDCAFDEVTRNEDEALGSNAEDDALGETTIIVEG